MPTAQMLWAGKRLSPDEEEHTRDVVAMLERTGNADLAAQFARFLPEHDAAWSPDELEERRDGAGLPADPDREPVGQRDADARHDAGLPAEVDAAGPEDHVERVVAGQRERGGRVQRHLLRRAGDLDGGAEALDDRLDRPRAVQRGGEQTVEAPLARDLPRLVRPDDRGGGHDVRADLDDLRLERTAEDTDGQLDGGAGHEGTPRVGDSTVPMLEGAACRLLARRLTGACRGRRARRPAAGCGRRAPSCRRTVSRPAPSAVRRRTPGTGAARGCAGLAGRSTS